MCNVCSPELQPSIAFNRLKSHLNPTDRALLYNLLYQNYERDESALQTILDFAIPKRFEYSKTLGPNVWRSSKTRITTMPSPCLLKNSRDGTEFSSNKYDLPSYPCSTPMLTTTLTRHLSSFERNGWTSKIALYLIKHALLCRKRHVLFLLAT